jgi:hypothetical protein
MAGMNNDFQDMLLDRTIGSQSEEKKTEETDSDGVRKAGNGLKNDGTLVGSGVQEAINLGVTVGSFGFEKDRYRYGEDEGSWAQNYILQSTTEQHKDLYNDLKEMYTNPKFEDFDHSGFTDSTFRSFANGQATADERNMLTYQQSMIAYNHREEIRSNNGVLDIRHLSKEEQSVMQPAVTLSEWAKNNNGTAGTSKGYLTDTFGGTEYWKAMNDVNQNHITTITFSKDQMKSMDQYHEARMQFNQFRAEGQSVWNQIDHSIQNYVSRNKEAIKADGADIKKLTAENYNGILYHMADKDEVQQGALFKGLHDLQMRDIRSMDPAAREASGIDLHSLTASHSTTNRHGARAQNRRLKFEETQNGEGNYAGQEMVKTSRDIRRAKRAANAKEMVQDQMGLAKANKDLRRFDRREEKRADLLKGQKERNDRRTELMGKSHLSDDERKELNRLNRRDRREQRSVDRIDQKNHRAVLDENGHGSYRQVLEKRKENAQKQASLHQQKHAAQRNRQYMDMAGSKGLQSIHAEENVLRRDKHALKEKERDARRATRRELLQKNPTAKNRKKLQKMDRKEQRRLNRQDSRPRQAMRVASGRRRDARERLDGMIAGAQNRYTTIKDKFWHNKLFDKIRNNPIARFKAKVKKKIIKKLKLEKLLAKLSGLLQALLPIIFIILVVLLALIGIGLLIFACTTWGFGGSDPTKNNPKNDKGTAPGYYQATVTALQDYQKSYLNYYSDQAKSSAQSQADSIASKYSGYLGSGTVKVSDANIRSITNEYGESVSDFSDTAQALCMARTRFFGTTLGDENQDPKDTITNMALYMTALWVGDENNSYIKGLASSYGGTSGLNHQIVVNPKFGANSEDNAYTHSSQGGIKDSEGNQYSYIYVNYGELSDSTREGCDNVWYKGANGSLSRTATDITWTKNTYGDNGSGTTPKSLGIGNPHIVSATVTQELEQTSQVQKSEDKTDTVAKKWKSGVKILYPSAIQSEDANGSDHFFRVNDNAKGINDWKALKTGGVFVISSGNNCIALKVGLITHKDKSRNYDSHWNFHYTEASANDVVEQGKIINKKGTISPVKLGQMFQLMDDSKTTTVTHTETVYNGTYADGGSVTYAGSSLKYDKNSNSFVMADGSAIPMPSGAHKRSRLTVTWQDGGRDGGRLIPQLDIFYVQDVQNLIKSDNWKTGDLLPESKSGGIFKKHQKQLEQVFGKGFNPGKDNTYTLSFPDISNPDQTTDQSGSDFWNDKKYDINSPWYDKKARKAWLDTNHPDWSEAERDEDAEPNGNVMAVCTMMGDRSTGYQYATEFWKNFDVNIKQSNVTGSFSQEQMQTIAQGLSQADLSGINASLNGQIPPGVQEMTRYALSRVGQPYTWGAMTETTADCSGFISCIWRHMGYSNTRYTTATLRPMGQTWGANDRLPAGSVLVNSHHTIYVAGWNESTQCYTVIEAMGSDYGIVVSDGTPGRKHRRTTQQSLHDNFPIVITAYCNK